MKDDIYKKLFFGLITLLVLLGLFYGNFSTETAQAQSSAETGRYQISAWAAQSSRYSNHYGYYVIDTTTGQVVGSAAKSNSVAPQQ